MPAEPGPNNKIWPHVDEGVVGRQGTKGGSMSDTIRFPSIRQAASELGIPEPSIIKTVVLTRGGYYVGHRFLFDGLQAVWLSAESVIRFFADDGSLLRTVEVGKEPSQKKAA